jgi:DNA mismatch endonuclease (patch repair protein)
MARVKSRDTGPEKVVRSILFRLGYRFRLHRRDLPGTPDIVLPGRNTAIFVHGCFWHQHAACAQAIRPASNRSYWDGKLDRNKSRDVANRRKLARLGWKVVVVWECQLNRPETLIRRLKKALC